jgi:hypothetical protein
MNNDRDKSAAVMIDVVPTLAMFSQVFCDVFRLRRSDNVLMKGKPLKASLRFFNPERIVNQTGVEAASGSFFCVIPTDHLEGGEDTEIIRFFKKYGRKDQQVKGVFIRYNLFEVQENQVPDYNILGTGANPAWSTAAGTLSPWYEGELCSVTMGRQLVAENPFLDQKHLAPLVCRVDTLQRLVSLDLLGSIPEQMISEPPATGFETYDLGDLRLQLQVPGKAPADVGTFTINSRYFNREQVLRTGGLIDLTYPENATLNDEAFSNGELVLLGQAKTAGNTLPVETVLMRESAWMIASDQAALYTDEGLPPEKGYRSYGAERQPCIVRVYRRGRPYTGALPMTVRELRISSPGTTATVSNLLETDAFYDGYNLMLPSDRACNAMYVFFPERATEHPNDLVPVMVRTGFFVNLRVLPRHDYSKYLDPAHPEYPTPVTFDVLYREVLKTYDVVFPVSSIITPFNEAYFIKGKQFLKNRMAPENWASYTYMPSSRDMSEDQWALFCTWAEQNNA